MRSSHTILDYEKLANEFEFVDGVLKSHKTDEDSV